MTPYKHAATLRGLKKEIDALEVLQKRKIELLNMLVKGSAKRILHEAGITKLSVRLDSECVASLTGFCQVYPAEGLFFTRCQACHKRLPVLKGTKA